jgi:hypothetical protein
MRGHLLDFRQQVAGEDILFVLCMRVHRSIRVPRPPPWWSGNRPPRLAFSTAPLSLLVGLLD